MYDEIHVTGFKKFGNVAVNPTELIIDELLKDAISNVYPSKLDVTVDEVDKYICMKKKQHQQCHPTKRILNIHFGVGPNKVYYLENCAYNNKDFRIPDNSGKVFEKQKICQKLNLDQPINTCLDLKQVMEKLAKLHHEVTISTDPGRYLCNYVYFNSLNQLKCQKENIDCLFVHFPALQIKTHEENMKFVKDLIAGLLKSQQSSK